MPETIAINGRGQLTAERFADEAGVRIRIEDGKNPEFWGELYLTVDELRGLVAECDHMAADYAEYEASRPREYPTPEDFPEPDPAASRGPLIVRDWPF